MEWSNEKTIRFLELYEAHPIIWNTTVDGHRDRKRVYNAWKEMAKEMGEPYSVAYLKKKKESLMASFRHYKKKVKDSKRNGTGTNGIYKPTWFAYSILDRFLGKKDAPIPTFNTADITEDFEGSEVNLSLSDDETTPQHEDSPGTKEHNAGIFFPTKPTNSSLQHASRAHRFDDEDSIAKKMDALLSLIQVNAHKFAREEKDVCDLYGNLIACKLRKFPEEERNVCMNQIDNLIFSYISKKFESSVPSSALLHTDLSFSPHFPVSSTHVFAPHSTCTRSPQRKNLKINKNRKKNMKNAGILNENKLQF